MGEQDRTATTALATRLAAGDLEALEELYRRWAESVFRLALRRLGDRGAAEELVQDVFVRLWTARQRWDPSRGSYEAWVFVLTRHLIYDRLRRRDGRRVMAAFLADGLEGEAAEDPALAEVMAVDAVRSYLESLPSEQAEAIRLVYVDGLTNEEAARRMATSPGTLKSRLRLALRRLRRQLRGGVL